MKSTPTQKTMTPPYSRYNFYSEDSPISLCKFETILEKKTSGTLKRDPSVEETLNPLMLEVLKTTDKLYNLVIESPIAYMAIENKLMSDPAKFRKEIARNKENLDPLQETYIKLFNLQDLENLKDNYTRHIANAVSGAAIVGSIAVKEAVEKKLKPSVHWKEDLEERRSPPAQEPEVDGSWVSRVQGSKSGRELE